MSILEISLKFIIKNKYFNTINLDDKYRGGVIWRKKINCAGRQTNFYPGLLVGVHFGGI